MFDNILVGLDGSEPAERALIKAFAIYQLTGGGLVRTVCVVDQSHSYAETADETEEAKRIADRYFHGVGRSAQLLADRSAVELRMEVVAGQPADVLIEKAKAYDSDLIIVGRSGYARTHHLVLGGTADKVVEHAPCAVLVVP